MPLTNVIEQPKELTTDEIRELFLRKVWTLIQYWNSEQVREQGVESKMQGLAFSILATLDGSDIDLPGFIVAPMGCAENIDFSKEQGQDWFPVNKADSVIGDIGGSLHEQFHDVGRKMGIKL